MAARTPTTPVAIESIGSNMLLTLDFTEVDSGDTYTDATLTDVVGYWANATDTVSGNVGSGSAVNVNYATATGKFTMYTAEANRVVKLYVLRKS
jgi:hypothetical protein